MTSSDVYYVEAFNCGVNRSLKGTCALVSHLPAFTDALVLIYCATDLPDDV